MTQSQQTCRHTARRRDTNSVWWCEICGLQLTATPEAAKENTDDHTED